MDKIIQAKTELKMLINAVGTRYKFSKDEFREALELSYKHPKGALECYRAIFNEIKM